MAKVQKPAGSSFQRAWRHLSKIEKIALRKWYDARFSTTVPYWWILERGNAAIGMPPHYYIRDARLKFNQSPEKKKIALAFKRGLKGIRK